MRKKHAAVLSVGIKMENSCPAWFQTAASASSGNALELYIRVCGEREWKKNRIEANEREREGQTISVSDLPTL